jgi:ribosome-associated heat shock protein Hsp15
MSEAAAANASSPMDTVRTDKWLWAVRLFKTRGLAAKACESGRVKRAGHALKPASPLRAGDLLEVPFPDGPGTRVVRVVEPITQRVGAPRAHECCEDLTPPAVLEARIAARKERGERLEGQQGRPTKQQRRERDQHHRFFE